MTRGKTQWKPVTVLAGTVLVAATGAAVRAGDPRPAREGPPAAWSAEWVGSFDPVTIDGKVWTFHTPPPPKDRRKVAPGHPRILMTRAQLPALRQKLAEPVYKPYMKRIGDLGKGGDVWANALLYHLGVDDKEAFGRKAREQALAGEYGRWGGSPGPHLGSILAYDWTAELLSAEEKKVAFKHMVSKFDFDAKWTHQGWYGNDVYGPMAQLTYKVLPPLAAWGDGVDDAWCRKILDRAYAEDPDLIGMYGPEKGQGLLDVLNTIGLDTGGSQAGEKPHSPTLGYTSMYLQGIPLLAAAWDRATGEPILRQLNWLRLLPHWLAYESYRWQFKADEESRPFAFGPAGVGLAALEYMTGLYEQIDPDMAALAAWHVQQFGTYRYPIIRRAILGDLRVKPKSPVDLKLPTAAYLRGADTFYSRSSWDEDATCVKMHIRYLDTNRYEHHTNTFTISKFGRLAPGSRPGKGTRNESNHSGLWMYDPKSTARGMYKLQGTAFWTGLRYRPRRPNGARAVVTDPVYRAGGPTAVGVRDGYRFASADAARLLNARGAKRYHRTLVHLLPTGKDREFVVIHDRTEATENVLRAWSLRTSARPTGNVQPRRKGELHLVFAGGDQITIANRRGNCHGLLHLTAVLPEKPVIEWRGDVGYQGVDPQGNKYGLSRKLSSRETAPTQGTLYRYGMGNLFISAAGYRPKQNYLVVMQVGDANTLSAEAAAKVTRVRGAGSDAVQFDRWVVAFATEPALRTKVTYRPSADGAGRHVIFDLEPGTYEVAKAGKPVAAGLRVAARDYSLSFASAAKAGEEFTVTRKQE